MKAYIIPSLALSVCLMAFTGNAQTRQKQHNSSTTEKETLVIRNNGQTVVEIKNGKVYVNGDEVASANEAAKGNVNKKIIIENGDGDMSAFGNGDFFGDKAPGGHRGMLGVLTDPKAKEKGAYVKRVTPGSAADKAGLKADDVITSMDGKSINSANELVDAVSGHEAGDKVTITYERDGKESQTEASLGSAGPQRMARAFRYEPGRGGSWEDFDIPNPMMQPFSFDANDGPLAPTPKLGIMGEDRADGSGVTVNEVKPNSPASSAGLQRDDVIKKLNGEKIQSVDDLQYILRDMSTGEKVKLQYERDGKTMDAEVTFPKQTRKKDL
ncbi:MAG: PDZ domain-containing protein [Bacteroidetes bacterium]|nr:PDZ domain-containing protein [Bacteroidota bacterium]